MSARTVELSGRTVELTHPDRPYFPDAGITKGDVVDYYRRVADVMLPHLRGRPLTLQRFPEGIEGEGFFQKEASEHFPDWIERVSVEKEDGRVRHALVEDAAGLVYLANQGTLTFHTWLSRADRLRTPDRLIFDLDPPATDDGKGEDFRPVREGARALRELLEGLGLPSFVMTTGSKGLHVAVPLRREGDFDEVRAFARGAAERLAADHPDRFTVEQRKAKRRGRVFLDFLRNGYAQTAVAPYSVRARPGAPVATPLDWSELGSGELRPDRYTVRNLFRRLAQKDDPWAEIEAEAVSLEGAAERLAEYGRPDG